MTRIKPGKSDSVRNTFAGRDRIFANRNDINDQIKIHELEDKMNEKSYHGTLDRSDKIHFRIVISPSNQKTFLKNFKRY